MQLVASILFFYVFGLGALLMTIYATKIIMQLIQINQEQQSKTKKSPPEAGNDSIKLHINEGQIEVTRLPGEQEET